MKNYIQEGDVLTLTAPYNVSAGGGLKTGVIVGIAASTVLSGVSVEVAVEGVFDVTKATGAVWAEGTLIYWDDTAKNFTTVSTANTKAGYAVAAALTGDVVGRLCLTPAI